MKPNKTTLKINIAVAVTSSMILTTSFASAGQIWDGGGADNFWNTTANWDSDTLPNFANAISFIGNLRNGATNNVTPDTTIGGINFTNDGSAGFTNAFTLSSNRITLGGNITTTAASAAITDIISLNMILNGNRTITTNANHNLSISGVISETGVARSLIKDGAGTLTLSGANTYGGTTITNGTIRVGATLVSGSVFGYGAVSFANVAGAGIDLNGFNATVAQLRDGGASGGNVNLGSNTLTISNIGGTYNGVISGIGGNLNVNGSTGGNFTGSHTYTGVTTIGSGNAGLSVTVMANGGVASGIGASTSAASNLVFTGAGSSTPNLRYNSASNASTDREFTLSGGGGFGVYGAGSLTFTSTANVTHGTVGAKTFLLAGNGAGGGTMGMAITDSGTGANITGINLGFANSANSGANWSLTNANNNFSGAIIHSATIYAGGMFSYASAGGGNAITFNQSTGTGGISYIGSTDKTMSGLIQANALSSGTITLGSSGAGAVNYSNAGSLGVAGASGAKGLVLSGTNTGNNILAGGWNNNTLGGAATITKNGASKWVLSGSNNYSGATVVNAGVLNIQSASALGSTTNGTSVVAAAALEIQGGITVGAEALSLNGTGISSGGALRNISGTNNFGGLVTLGSATRINSDAGTLNITNAGTITGAGLGLTLGGAGNISISSIIGTTTGTLTKDGAGTVTLGGVNTYTGATAVNAGSLIVNGSTHASSAVTVALGATLGGTGTVNGATTINGIHSPGNSPGTQNFGALTYNAGSSVLWELVGNTTASRGTNYDGINVSSALAFNGATTLTLNFNFGASAVEWNDSFWDGNYTGTNGWLVYSGATSLTGFSNLSLNPSSSWLDENGDTLASSRSTGNFFLFQSGNDIYLNFVPEPSTALLSGLGLLALLRRRR